MILVLGLTHLTSLRTFLYWGGLGIVSSTGNHSNNDGINDNSKHNNIY